MNRRLAIYAACILLLEWFCFVNAYVVDLKGASIDATRFHEAATTWASFGDFGMVSDAEFYVQFLGIVYSLFGQQEFIGAQLSVIALVIGAVYFEKILKLFRVQGSYYWVIPFLLWPSLLTRSTTVMREPLLICFTVLLVYNLLVFRRYDQHRNAVYAIAISLIAALFHKAYAVLVIVVVPYILFFVMKQKSIFYRSGIFYLRICLGLLFGGLVWIVYRELADVRGLKPVMALISGDFEYMQMIVDAKTSKGARATYAVNLDFSSLTSILASYPAVLVYYLFSPFPWMIGSIYDAYASLEGAIRITGFLCFFAAYKNNWIDRKDLQIVFAILLALSLIWAAGTANYGTASRHHTTTIFFFLLFIALKMRRRYV